jgi:hypothetical protein
VVILCGMRSLLGELSHRRSGAVFCKLFYAVLWTKSRASCGRERLCMFFMYAGV